ncbi:glycosyltransferase [Leptolyngbya iicbica]|nr:glycosyltransferase [Leptolyngbya sp. LK]
MKIVLVITGLEIGGAEMMLLKILENLSQEFSPEVVSLTTFGKVGHSIQALGIPVTALDMKLGISTLITLVKLVRLLRAKRPHIVHTWMYHADLVGGLAARLAKVPIVIWNIRHSNFASQKTKLTTKLVIQICTKLSYFIPDCIQCCSINARDIHIELGYDADKFIVIPNGFDLQRFYPNPQARKRIRQELNLSSSNMLVGMIGRFHPQKNHLAFFRAMSHVYCKLPKIHLLLAGKNINSGNLCLMAYIHETGVKAIVHLLDERDDTPDLMASLDLLVLSSSEGEAFPNVVGEAMACAVPCVVTDVGDSAYIVANTGKIVDANDEMQLMQAILSVLNLSESERMTLGRMARQRIETLFDIRQITQQYQDLYLQQCSKLNLDDQEWPLSSEN